jgi:hypothetical protein
VFWPLQSNSEVLRVPEDSQVPILGMWVSSSHSFKSGVATHTLNHLQKLHCVVVDEVHLLLSDSRSVMKHLLPSWAMGCQLVTLTASLSPSQETDLKIMMSMTFTIIRMSTVRLLIRYVVDEVVNVNNSSNGIAMYLMRHIGQSYISSHDSLLSECWASGIHCQ